MPVLPNIYVDGNRSKRGLVLDLKTPEDRARLLDLVAASDVVVENAMAGAWERLGLDEAALRAVNPALVYARAKGFGVAGPLASRPTFDYVVQAATGMEMTQGGGGRPVPVNVVGQRLRDRAAAGGGDRVRAVGTGAGRGGDDGRRVVGADGDALPVRGRGGAGGAGAVGDQVGDDVRGPSVGCHLYRAKDGWVVVCCVTESHLAGLYAGVGLGGDGG